METQNLVKNTTRLTVLVIVGGLFLWWNATSATSAARKKEETRQSAAEGYSLYQDTNGRAADIKRGRNGRCLLSLDGGGIRWLSQLTILYEISNRIMHDLGLDKPPRLCDYFDMIGGVGNGGLLAILVGRFGLTVQQAWEEYLKIMSYVSLALVDATGLDCTLKAIVKKYTGSSETLMHEPDSSTSHCKVFVGAVVTGNMSRMVKFRSYPSRREQEINLPIWQVARATLAYPGSFPSIRSESAPASITYMSGEIGWKNPSKEVIREFEAGWEHQGILCFASIGAGQQGVIRLDTLNGSNIRPFTLEKMATDCQQVAEEIAYRFQGQNNYFRLNVDQGLQHTEGPQPSLDDVIVHTKAYLGSAWVDISVDRLVDSLLRAIEVFPWQTTRENFEKTILRYISDTQSCSREIKINNIKNEFLEINSILESIREASSNEEEWLGLAKVVDKHGTFIGQDVVPKIYDPLLEDPLWPSTSKYFRELREIHKSLKALIQLPSDQIWGTQTGENLLSKWAVDLEECFKGIQASLSSEVYSHVSSLRKRQQKKEKEELLSWLSTLQPQRRHDDVLAKRSKGTGMWFLNATTFKTWSELGNIQKSCALLSFGVPGAGKTILCASVIQYLLNAARELNIGVAFIYCDYRDRPNQTIVNMIGSLAKQLLSQAHSIPVAVENMYKYMAKQERTNNIETAPEILQLILQLFDYVYICIDALDECLPETRRRLLNFVKTLNGTTLRVFLTGRPSVEAELVRALAGIPVSTIPIVAHQEDIRLYLSEKFEQDRYPEAMDDTLKAEIMDKIVGWSQGIFLLSMLQTETVLEHDTKRDRREALLRVPAELSDTYTATLDRVRQQHAARSQRALLILTWVYYAERQLRVEELRHALAVKAGDPAFDKDGIPSENALVDCCLGLMVIERETSTIRLTHFTLQEYFDSHREALLPSGDTIIVQTCLTYLGFDLTSWAHQDLKESSPFIEYVATNVGHHLRKGSDAPIAKQTLSLLSKKDKFQILEAALHDSHQMLWHKGGSFETSPSHWLAFFGISPVAGLLLDAASDINAKDSLGMTPLCYALRNNHEEVVRFLINSPGIDLNASTKRGETPLSLAAEYNHDAIVRLLIDTPGVALNPKDTNGHTPLALAAQLTHHAIVERLINTPGVDINPMDESGKTPLSLAASTGSYEVVQLLVGSPDIQLHVIDDFGLTAFNSAVEACRDEVIQLLKAALENEAASSPEHLSNKA